MYKTAAKLNDAKREALNLLFIFLDCFLLWLTLWLVASWRSNRVKYCWQLKLQSYLLAVNLFFSIRMLMNETHRIATKETLKNGHQKSSSVLIYLLLRSVTALSQNLYSGLFLPLCLLFTGVTRSFLTAWLPFSTFHVSLPWTRFQALTCAPALLIFHSWTADCPCRSTLAGYKNRKLKCSHCYSLSFFLIAAPPPIAILFPSQLIFIFGELHLFQI